MNTFFNIALIITSIAVVVLVVLQNRGVGMGSIAGDSDPSTIFTQRRGVEKVIFNLTMVFSILLVILVVLSILLFK
ncbi:MAG: preprotein translocase subunit SecG [Anaerolineaceae bacterium]|nr:preprotein translocase subunit SecG [Anaerolineaceae bacterium]